MTISNEEAGAFQFDAFAVFVGIFLVIALVVGGASASRTTANWIQVCGVPVLGAGLFRLYLHVDRVAGRAWQGMLLLAMLAGLMLIQLVPLPPQAWSRLPGRALIVEAFRAASIPLPWEPITLTPEETWRSFLGLIPACAIFIAVSTLGMAERWFLALLVVLVAMTSVFIAIGQRLGGPGSLLWFYGGEDAPVGFFANRNHQATFLASSLPLTAYLLKTFSGRTPGLDWTLIAIGFAASSVILLGGMITTSRAGVLLMGLGAVSAAAIGFWQPLKRRGAGLPWVLVFCVCVAVAAAALSVSPLVDRLEAGAKGELRFQIFPTVARGGLAFAPLGSGIGSFATTYQMFETPATLTQDFVNHAHNEYLETWLEAGVLGVFLICGFAFWSSRAVLALSRSSDPSQLAAGLSGGAILLICLLHSLVDYPLRTPAMACAGALAAALLAGTRHGSEGGDDA